MAIIRSLKNTYQAQERREDQKIHIDGLTSPIFLKRSKRAKRFILRVHSAERKIILTSPIRGTLKSAKEFAIQHKDWVEQRLAIIPPSVPFEHESHIPFRGVQHILHFSGKMRSHEPVNTKSIPITCTNIGTNTGINIVTDITQKQTVQSIQVHGPREHAPRRLKDWLKRQAKSDLNEKVWHHAKALSVRPKRISVRDQKSRWGSCSSTGVLSFSWRLILAPDYVLDYVAAHEVAHLREMNHSPRFWSLVRDTMPNMDAAEDWLKKNGVDLHRYG